jgi:hypothetical protein
MLTIDNATPPRARTPASAGSPWPWRTRAALRLPPDRSPHPSVEGVRDSPSARRLSLLPLGQRRRPRGGKRRAQGAGCRRCRRLPRVQAHPSGRPAVPGPARHHLHAVAAALPSGPSGHGGKGGFSHYAGTGEPSPWANLKRQVFLGTDTFVESMQSLVPSRMNLRELPQARGRPIPPPLECGRSVTTLAYTCHVSAGLSADNPGVATRARQLSRPEPATSCFGVALR